MLRRGPAPRCHGPPSIGLSASRTSCVIWQLKLESITDYMSTRSEKTLMKEVEGDKDAPEEVPIGNELFGRSTFAVVANLTEDVTDFFAEIGAGPDVDECQDELYLSILWPRRSHSFGCHGQDHGSLW